MSKSSLSARKRRQRVTESPEPLKAGIHAALIELKSGAGYRVRLLDGTRTIASPAEGVSPRLLDECFAVRRLVMLTAGERGPIILGALQTEPTLRIREEDGALEVDAAHIRLRAEQTITLKAGLVSLQLEKSGLARVEGNRMVLDVAALLRVLSAKVELP